MKYLDNLMGRILYILKRNCFQGKKCRGKDLHYSALNLIPTDPATISKTFLQDDSLHEPQLKDELLFLVHLDSLNCK